MVSPNSPLLSDAFLETAALQELAIRHRIAATAFPAESIAGELSINRAALAGKSVIDIASGSSDMVSWLSDGGVQAIGIDPAYGDVDALLARGDTFADRNLKKPLPRFMMSDQDKATELFRQTYENSTAAFLADFKQNPDRYKAASATELPFDDEVFDAAFCHSYITAEPGYDSELTTVIIFEALRVLRPGATLRFGPLVSTLPDLKFVRGNIRNATERAKSEGLADKTLEFSVRGGAKTFQIVKARRQRRK